MSQSHLVIPGQVIATEAENDMILKGYGTYEETTTDTNTNEHDGTSASKVLRAAVTGTVQRVNQLIAVDAFALHSTTSLVVGDLVVGRIVNITAARWGVQLFPHNNDELSSTASLPLAGVQLPDQQQRIRTAADALEMRHFLRPGDIVTAEVHQIQQQHTIILHTRSGVRYGHRTHGCSVHVPANLMVRRNTQYVVLCENQFQVWLGCNGWIWMQKNTTTSTSTSTTTDQQPDSNTATTETTTTTITYSPSERRNLARLANAARCLEWTSIPVTPEALETVYNNAADLPVSHMVWPEHVVALTAGL